MQTVLEEGIYNELELYSAAKRASIFIDRKNNCVIVQATDTYIPIEEFKIIFHKVGEFVKQNDQIEKLVFDKRSLKVFHQPSMEWYFTQWKMDVFQYGLKKHRKLLPEDEVFRDSVKIGREKILRENPDLDLDKLDIRYYESLKEALEN
ncbi:hypothetical protein AB9P05_22660 [Roseivirga sp. BDSF3-8]|uniref:hypothetical protein n=1 Tax=Roseivirga sp. BDSF3-8 TaxID=3241598 RepID=UPI0035319A44